MDPSLIFRDLARPLRLRILVELLGGEACVTDLQYRLGMLSQQVVSEQLASMRRSGLVVAVKEGNRRYYSLRPSEGSEFLRNVFRCVECCRDAMAAADAEEAGQTQSNRDANTDATGPHGTEQLGAMLPC
jgi:DNA-binding transcriptional ArsR family regulator